MSSNQGLASTGFPAFIVGVFGFAIVAIGSALVFFARKGASFRNRTK